MPGASPLADTLDSVRRLEDAGASAIVMRSLFEEQILQERFGTSGFTFGPDSYLELLRRIKASVSVPVIASINGTTTEGWLKYARLLQRAEADAVELNFYYLAADPAENAASGRRSPARYHRRAEGIDRDPARGEAPRRSTRRCRISPARSTRLVHRASCCSTAFIRPTSIRTSSTTVPMLRLSTSDELLLRLRWLAILSATYRGSLAVTGGVHQPIDAIKAIMAGADAVQMVSTLLTNGVQQLTAVRDGVARWCDEHGYESIDQIRDSMSLAFSSHPRRPSARTICGSLQSWTPAG